MSKKEMITKILDAGGIIRKIDGRFQNSFVDMNALKQLIDSGYAEVYDNKGMEFVRKAKAKK